MKKRTSFVCDIFGKPAERFLRLPQTSFQRTFKTTFFKCCLTFWKEVIKPKKFAHKSSIKKLSEAGDKRKVCLTAISKITKFSDSSWQIVLSSK